MKLPSGRQTSRNFGLLNPINRECPFPDSGLSGASPVIRSERGGKKDGVVKVIYCLDFGLEILDERYSLHAFVTLHLPFPVVHALGTLQVQSLS